MKLIKLWFIVQHLSMQGPQISKPKWLTYTCKLTALLCEIVYVSSFLKT